MRVIKDDGIVVQDLAYGEVLFDFFQDDYFGALTRLLAAQQRNEIPASRGRVRAHARRPVPVVRRASARRRDLRARARASPSSPSCTIAPGSSSRRFGIKRGYLPEAEAALARITGELPEELEPERHMLTRAGADGRRAASPMR